MLLLCCIVVPFLNANSVDSDQMPHSAASDLGLHCLPISLLWDARHKWANLLYTTFFKRYVLEDILF